ncbi:hypothetical protein PG997_012206 [Apiospora hydei]|uniref:Uncharacterized protein n=1 Tax=Apiospora hydei TaxID=1337664 RepID=A0ABR1V2N9_9PEZI
MHSAASVIPGVDDRTMSIIIYGLFFVVAILYAAFWAIATLRRRDSYWTRNRTRATATFLFLFVSFAAAFPVAMVGVVVYVALAIFLKLMVVLMYLLSAVLAGFATRDWTRFRRMKEILHLPLLDFDWAPLDTEDFDAFRRPRRDLESVETLPVYHL